MWEAVAMWGSGAVVAIGVVYIALRMLRKEARRGGEDKEARETLEKIVDQDRKMHKLAGRAIPMYRDEQLRRLKRLRDKIHSRQR